MRNNTTKKYYLITDDFIENTFAIYDDLLSYISNHFYDCVNDIRGILKVETLKDNEIIRSEAINLRKVIFDVDELRIEIIANQEEWRFFEDDNRLRLSDLI